MKAFELQAVYKSYVDEGRQPISVDFSRAAKTLVWVGMNGERWAMALDAAISVDEVLVALFKLQESCRRKGRRFVYTVY